eukprot:1180197-Prorocentrum_minimum.AAC.1
MTERQDTWHRPSRHPFSMRNVTTLSASDGRTGRYTSAGKAVFFSGVAEDEASDIGLSAPSSSCDEPYNIHLFGPKKPSTRVISTLLTPGIVSNTVLSSVHFNFRARCRGVLKEGVARRYLLTWCCVFAAHDELSKSTQTLGSGVDVHLPPQHETGTAGVRLRTCPFEVVQQYHRHSANASTRRSMNTSAGPGNTENNTGRQKAGSKSYPGAFYPGPPARRLAIALKLVKLK